MMQVILWLGHLAILQGVTTKWHGNIKTIITSKTERRGKAKDRILNKQDRYAMKEPTLNLNLTGTCWGGNPFDGHRMRQQT